ncbi:predicted protein [Postia placenta Mad-698-R]|nr:predicted protein [Postia placenta Mad-698-R]
MSDGIVLQPAFNEALGPALIGTIAALALVMSIIDAASIYAHAQSQIVIYYAAAYPKDKLLLKGLAHPWYRLQVTILWLLDTAAAVVDAMIVWHYTIKTKNDIIRLVDVFRGTLRQSEYALAVGDFQLDGHTNLTAERFRQAPTIFIVQCYYIYTIWILFPNDDLLQYKASMSLSSFGKGCCSVYVQGELTIGLVTGLLQTSTATLVDICATVTLLFVLRGQKTGFKAYILQLVYDDPLMLMHITAGLIALFKNYQLCRNDEVCIILDNIPSPSQQELNARQHLNRSGQKYLSNGFSIMDLPGDPTSPDDIPLGDRQMGNIDHASRYIGYELFQAHTIHE